MALQTLKFTCKMYVKMLELTFFWESTSKESDGDKISCAKKLNASMMLPCEHAFLNKI